MRVAKNSKRVFVLAGLIPREVDAEFVPSDDYGPACVSLSTYCSAELNAKHCRKLAEWLVARADEMESEARQ